MLEAKGKIISANPNWAEINNPTVISVTVDIPFTFEHMATLDRFKGMDVKISVKQWRDGRSRNANSYFYVLVEKLANALRVSKPYIHNLMLRKYGQLQRIDDKPIWVVLPETDEVASKVDEDETLHVRPTNELKEGKDGRMYRTYLLLKGSHELNTKEFSILLDGIISECHEVGVETATPEEISRMKAMLEMERKVENGKL